MADLVISTKTSELVVTPIKGSTEHPCIECGESLTVSPSGVTQIQLGAALVCVGCAAGYIAKQNDPDIKFGIAPGGREEIAEYIQENGLFQQLTLEEE